MSIDCSAMMCHLFDPEKSALENFFYLIHRRNRVMLTEQDVEVETPQAIEPDEHGDNTIILVKPKEGGIYCEAEGAAELYYARADLDTHYPFFQIDIEELEGVNDVDALTAYLDGKFNLIDGEFELDLEDPLGSLFTYTTIDLKAKADSLIYIGTKSIHIFWSKNLRRIAEDGRIRVTEDGQVRTID